MEKYLILLCLSLLVLIIIIIIERLECITTNIQIKHIDVGHFDAYRVPMEFTTY